MAPERFVNVYKELANALDVSIKDIDERNVDDLYQLCITADNFSDPTFMKGMEEKRRWAMEML